MERWDRTRDVEETSLAALVERGDRRTFLKWSGALAAVTAIGCEDSPLAPARELPVAFDHESNGQSCAPVTLDFANDLGVLNYAYALEQLEAAFYIQVVSPFYRGVNGREERLLIDLRAHEIVHREFFRAALGANAIPDLCFDFSRIWFNARGSVLGYAKLFEDLGVMAYNGAAPYLQNPLFLLTAGKIVSVEARHASALRDVLLPNGRSFAPDAFDAKLRPAAVLQAASKFVENPINLINVPVF
ncbi:MAG: ferritin-like domain-containing protein [Longimicrobiales bacterium]